MVLVIDRGIDKRGIYTYSLGIEFDVMIGSWDIYINSVPKETMADLDMIITKSPDLVFCVTHIKHPLLLEGRSNDSKTIDTDFLEVVRRNLREYFALRLIHRRYELKLYEFGKRIFND